MSKLKDVISILRAVDYKKINTEVKQRRKEKNLDTILGIQYLGNLFKKNTKN